MTTENSKIQPPGKAELASTDFTSNLRDDESTDIDPAEVDRLLAERDPEFAAKIKEIQNSEFSTSVAIEAVDIEAFLKEGEKIKIKKEALKKLKFKERAALIYSSTHAMISRIIDNAQNFSIHIVKGSGRIALGLVKNLIKLIIRIIGQSFSKLKNLPRQVKLLSISVILLAVASSFSIYMSWKGHFLPRFNKEYLTGFGEHADEVFDYKDDDSKESFDSEVRHPEHMFEVERVIVNLKAGEDVERIPMGLFEFYIETNSQEAVVEIGDRKTEVRHIIERVIEQMPYSDLVSPQGKNKLKFIVRKELNEFLTKSHHVRQVYIKTFVLKP